MQLSRYCKIYPKKDKSETFILFSTKEASIIEANRPYIESIRKNRLPKKEKEELLELGIIVDDLKKERTEMLHFVDDINSINNIFRAYVALNLDCNLACRYCFEGTRKGKHYMTKETADSFVEFVKRRTADSKGIDEINLVFYGGEPLLSSEMIIYISKRIKEFVKRKGMNYSFSIITNGTLLTKKNVDKLKSFGLKDVSVTVDGPENIHNSYRPFKSGRGSFDVIFKNVKKVCEIVDIQIGGNYTKDNYSRFPLLLDYMMDNGLTPDKVSDVRFDFVTKESEGVAPPDFREGVLSLNEPWLFDANIFLREEILKRGYKAQRVMPVACMIEFKERMLINYDGSIYKCPGLIGRKEFCVGNVKTGIKDYTKSHNLYNWKNDECLDCSYLPLCFGGCRYMKLVRDGNMNGVDCKKPFFDATLEALVKQDIKYGLTDGSK